MFGNNYENLSWRLDKGLASAGKHGIWGGRQFKLYSTGVDYKLDLIGADKAESKLARECF